jgi:hypothetical protein
MLASIYGGVASGFKDASFSLPPPSDTGRDCRVWWLFVSVSVWPVWHRPIQAPRRGSPCRPPSPSLLSPGWSALPVAQAPPGPGRSGCWRPSWAGRGAWRERRRAARGQRLWLPPLCRGPSERWGPEAAVASGPQLGPSWSAGRGGARVEPVVPWEGEVGREKRQGGGEGEGRGQESGLRQQPEKSTFRLC